tara:strand:+ start:572 stop:883 length:312 start_codon:yes stop_codon:yes gene_type:complete
MFPVLLLVDVPVQSMVVVLVFMVCVLCGVVCVVLSCVVSAVVPIKTGNNGVDGFVGFVGVEHAIGLLSLCLACESEHVRCGFGPTGYRVIGVAFVSVVLIDGY